MPSKAQPEFYVARSSGVIKIDGRNEFYTVNQTIVHKDSALYRAIPDRFQPVERPQVEKATAAPGERR